MLITPDRSEYKPPSAASTSGVDNRMVENRSEIVKIWRITRIVLRALYFVLCTSCFVLRALYFVLCTSCFVLRALYFVLCTSWFVVLAFYLVLVVSCFVVLSWYFFLSPWFFG